MGNYLGILGAACFLLSYYLLQKDKEFAKTPTYSIMNLAGAVLMLLSVCFDWNIGALINNSFWIILSLYGLYDLRRQSAYMLKEKEQAI